MIWVLIQQNISGFLAKAVEKINTTPPKNVDPLQFWTRGSRAKLSCVEIATEGDK